MESTSCSKKKAIKALKEEEGDIVNAIMSIKPNAFTDKKDKKLWSKKLDGRVHRRRIY